MSYLTSIAALLLASGAIVFVTFTSRRRIVNDHQPSEAERLAQYERRRGEFLAAERLRHARVAQAIDARATVQPKVTSRLPQ